MVELSLAFTSRVIITRQAATPPPPTIIIIIVIFMSVVTERQRPRKMRAHRACDLEHRFQIQRWQPTHTSQIRRSHSHKLVHSRARTHKYGRCQHGYPGTLACTLKTCQSSCLFRASVKPIIKWFFFCYIVSSASMCACVCVAGVCPSACSAPLPVPCAREHFIRWGAVKM